MRARLIETTSRFWLVTLHERRASEEHGGRHPHQDVQDVRCLWRLLPLLAMQVRLVRLG
jgi:hypothetical protein